MTATVCHFRMLHWRIGAPLLREGNSDTLHGSAGFDSYHSGTAALWINLSKGTITERGPNGAVDYVSDFEAVDGSATM
jgi:hypothetical protein